ncbi:response regulator transcription factor [Desulfuromonas sp. KJ2020]|nr:response regulator transcription factor [Desulfuromonas sp. KJ2020]MCP3176809.1 response regulator transcription factor [Desulfuromonas sp. KJ2020]
MMPQARILLVEDEPSLARGLLFNLEAEGYVVTHADSGEKALEAFNRDPFSLLVLDLSLPGIDGLEVCRQIREKSPRLPILILTARSQERDRVKGLAAGADDYLTKPFSLDEFLLRIKGMLRRSGWYKEELPPSDFYAFGGNEVNLREQTATTPRGEVSLTELEIKMLRIFFDREGEILSRAELLKLVWGMAPDTETRTLDNFIVRLRRYFEPDPANPVHFLTVRGRGYRFVAQP